MEDYQAENIYKVLEDPLIQGGGEMAKVLIATLYNPDAVLLASTKLSPDRLVLLINKEPDKTQENSLSLIKDSLGKVIDVKTAKIDPYDIVGTAEEVVKIIDMTPKDDTVYVNITSGRKTMALGLLFAAYSRNRKVKKIAYNPYDDKNKVVYLPILSFDLSESQKKILEALKIGKFENQSDLAKKVDISTAMLYRAVKELQDKGLVGDNQVELTDGGRIAVL